MLRLSRKDIFKFYATFEDGVAQWLTRCREDIKKCRDSRIFPNVGGATVAKRYIFNTKIVFTSNESEVTMSQSCVNQK